MSFAVIFDPLVSWAVLGLLCCATVAALAFAFLRRMAGAWFRGLASLLLLLALSGPVLQQEERQPLNDIVLVVTDQSSSQKLGMRQEQTERASNHLLSLLEQREATEVRQIIVPDGPDGAGTLAMSALTQELSQIPQSRLAGIIAISDGLIHDPDALSKVSVPLHLLRTGEEADWDRRIIVDKPPAFAIVDEAVTVTLRIEDNGRVEGREQSTRLAVAVGADEPLRFEVPIGRDIELPITIRNGGKNTIRFEIPEGEGELTTRNNSYLMEINGVRDRLRVLLVSGEPHAGGRTWRNLLKSDSSVDLVHFTILRPPEKHDGVPVGELSLIAFPTRELFIDKIDDFDLIIFDRYKRRGILPSSYLENVRDYVKRGGAILVAAGPDFASADSIYRSPLGEILPARPTARVLEEKFEPGVTEIGERHPVTQGLRAQAGGTWGSWMRQIELEQTSGDLVMHGADERPLLLLDRVDEGRVALLASDHAWLWARGYEGGGPQLELLKRLSHWLMKEPELEEEALFAMPDEGGLKLFRRSLSDERGAVSVTTPSGDSIDVEMRQVEPGLFEGNVEVEEVGLYRLQDTDLQSVVGLGPISPREFEATIATDSVLEPAIDNTRGGAFAIEQGLPRLRTVREGRNAAGASWLGLLRRGAYDTIGVKQYPLMPPWLVLVLFASFIVFAWMREGRN